MTFERLRMAPPNAALLVTRTVLRGVSQIFLQESAWCGAMLLAAIALQNWTWALACLLGCAVASLTGLALKEGVGLAQGLLGFNGALAGLAVAVLLQPGPWVWGGVTVASLLSTGVFQVWRKRSRLPPYTAPFVLVTWGLMALGAPLGLPMAGPAGSAPPLLGGPWDGALRGVGQVVFLDHALSGLLCLIALAVSGLRPALLALTASLLALLLAHMANLSAHTALLGVYGFNAVLTVLALRPQVKGFGAWWLTGVALSLLVLLGFQRAGLPALTAPFVLTTWCLMWAQRRVAAACT